jgi:hypothetical protein
MNLEELNEQKEAEIRLIADLTLEATLAVDEKLSRLTERWVNRSPATQ